MAAVEDYIRAEQRLVSIGKRVNPKTVYVLLFGACLHRVFISHFLGRPIGPSAEIFVKQVVAATIKAWEPIKGAPSCPGARRCFRDSGSGGLEQTDEGKCAPH